MAVSHDLYTFTVLGASAGIPSLAYGALHPTGWLFKCIKAWNSILVYLAEDDLICCFNIYIYINLSVCGL